MTTFRPSRKQKFNIRSPFQLKIIFFNKNEKLLFFRPLTLTPKVCLILFSYKIFEVLFQKVPENIAK
jgi:hypothetical protein